MQLWDTESKKPLSLPADFLEFEEVRSGLAFSPDGDHFATVGAKKVVVWDIRDIDKGSATYLHVAGVNTLAFSRRGDRLATGSDDGTVQVWFLAVDDLLAHAQTLPLRPLSENECKRYHIEPCPKSK